jgi:chain length determinant protein EpsF
MTLGQALLALRARWILAASIWLVTVVLVIGFNLHSRPQYTSNATVVVDGKTVDAIAGVALANNGVIPGYMATQVDVAQSERVILRAARAMKLTEDPERNARWRSATEGRGSFNTWLVEQIQAKLIVRPSRESNALSLSFTDPDPVFAAEMMNAIVRAYIDTTLELRVEPAKQYNAFFDERARQLRDALEAAQSKLSAYQRQNNLLPSTSDERFDVENARLLELSTQAVQSEAAASEAGSRQAEARADPSRIQEVLNNPVVSALSTELAGMQSRLTELRSRLGDNHPQVAQMQSGVDELQARLAAATRAASGSVGVASNVLSARAQQARRALEEQRARVLQLKVKHDEAAVLQRDVANAQRAYDGVLARVSETDLESQNRQTNVSILQLATPAAFPSSPKIALNTVIGVVLGFLLALAGPLLREMFDRRLRSEADIVSVLNQPMLVEFSRAQWSVRAASMTQSEKKMRVVNGRLKPLRAERGRG